MKVTIKWGRSTVKPFVSDVDEDLVKTSRASVLMTARSRGGGSLSIAQLAQQAGVKRQRSLREIEDCTGPLYPKAKMLADVERVLGIRCDAMVTPPYLLATALHELVKHLEKQCQVYGEKYVDQVAEVTEKIAELRTQFEEARLELPRGNDWLMEMYDNASRIDCVALQEITLDLVKQPASPASSSAIRSNAWQEIVDRQAAQVTRRVYVYEDDINTIAPAYSSDRSPAKKGLQRRDADGIFNQHESSLRPFFKTSPYAGGLAYLDFAIVGDYAVGLSRYDAHRPFGSSFIYGRTDAVAAFRAFFNDLYASPKAVSLP